MAELRQEPLHFQLGSNDNLILGETSGNLPIKPNTTEETPTEETPTEETPTEETPTEETTQGGTQNSVTKDDNNELSTDLTTLFGSYGDIFNDIITQLLGLFTGSAQDIFDMADINKDYGIGNTNPLQNFLGTIDAICRKLKLDTEARGVNLISAYSQMMSYYMSILSASMENQFNIQQWQIENDYNSPAKQLKRLSDAGLNPLYAFGSSWNSASGSVSGANPGSASSFAASGATAKDARLRKRQAVQNSVDGVMDAAGQYVDARVQYAQLDQQNQRIGLEAAKTKSDIGAQQFANAESDERRKGMAQARAQGEKSFTYELQEKITNLELLSQQKGLNEQELQNKKALEDDVRTGIAIAVKDFEQRYELNQVNYKISKKQLEELDERVKYVRTQSDVLKIQRDFEKSTGIPWNSPFTERFALLAASGIIKPSDWFALHQFTSTAKALDGQMSLDGMAASFANFIQVQNKMEYINSNMDSYQKFLQDTQNMKTATDRVIKGMSPYQGQIDSVDPVDIQY